jgi:hypothetical protein
MVSLVVLLVGLALAAFNLLLMTTEVGTHVGLQQSWQTLMTNYASRTSGDKQSAAFAPETSESAVRLLYSVTGGEAVLPGLQEKIADPIVDYHLLAEQKLDAVLIERKLPLSKFVRVRLFFADRTESEFLWPYAGADEDWWVPPCSPDPADDETPVCPASFLERYPEIESLMKAGR